MNLTKPQQLIYEMEKFSGGAISVICGSMLLNGNKNPQEITTAINELYKINDALRIRISETNGNVQQTVSEYTEQDFEVLNFNSKDELDIYAQSYAMKPFDLYGSLCEFKVVVLPDKYGCLVKLHHMIGDAWTLALLGTQLNSIFNGETVQAYSYVDYIESEKKYLDGKRYEKDRTFFLEQFKKCDEPTLLNEKNIDSLKSVRKTFVIEKDKAEAIKKYCSDNNSSPFMLFMSALAIYMNRIKMNQERFYIGTAVLNRSGAKERNTAGMFINTVPLLIELDNTKPFSENISALEDSVMSVFRHQKFNYGDILKSIRQEYNFTEKLYDVMLSYQNAVITGNEIESTWYHSGMQSESLQIHIDDRDNENIYRIHYDYQTDKFSEDDVFAMHSHICKLLFDAINNGNKKIYELEMLSDEEYQKVIFDFNDTAVDYPREKCIHELFEEQARKTPDKIALVFEDKQFTYKQLDEMSNSLAHYLLENGIKDKDIIGVHCNRSELVIIAQLATLKLGCAFLPIDKRYPVERVQGLLNDCDVAVLLTDSDNKYDSYNVRQINIVEGLSSSIERINIECKLDDICYVIYTSGSTGKPKGCSLTYRGVTNFCKNNNLIPYCKKLSKQIVVSVNTISFDYFIAETLLPLSNGYTVVLANENQSNSKDEFKYLVLKNGVNMIMTTPTRLNIYTENEDKNGYLNNIDIIVSSGEALSPELLSHLNKISNAKIFNPLGPSECSIWNTDGNFKNNKKIYKPCIHELFEEQARKTPDKIALVFEDKKFTYKQLDEMSNSLAHYLREEKNIQPNDIVPIIAKRSWHIIVAMLGILKAGGAYMPVDPTYPMDRVSFMIEETKSKIALTFGYEGKLETDTISLETFNYSNNIKSIENLNTSSDLCYLIFTSGSTGKPKAVMISHLNVSNYTNDNEINVVHRIIKKSYKSILSVAHCIQRYLI